MQTIDSSCEFASPIEATPQSEVPARRASRAVSLVLLSPALALGVSGCAQNTPVAQNNDCDRNRQTATREDDCDNSRRTRSFVGGRGVAGAVGSRARSSTDSQTGSDRGGFGGMGRFFSGSGS